uniref:Uncharacterized protein n=1 Tax=Romanomermis culicivorax TaxID=13658 RepID=A0A915INE6_ROMCU
MIVLMKPESKAIYTRENEETTGITIGSLYGTVKASQSADNIFIMQKKYYRFKDAFYEKYFQRFSTDKGFSPCVSGQPTVGDRFRSKD